MSRRGEELGDSYHHFPMISSTSWKYLALTGDEAGFAAPLGYKGSDETVAAVGCASPLLSCGTHGASHSLSAGSAKRLPAETFFFE